MQKKLQDTILEFDDDDKSKITSERLREGPLDYMATHKLIQEEDDDILNLSDVRIIQQALEEYTESEYAGEIDINRAKIALGRIKNHLKIMESVGRNITELRYH